MKTFAGYYTEFKLPQDFELPNNLLIIIREVWDRKYRDLYENGRKCNVEEAFEEIMQTFGMPINTIEHQRYVYMAMGMALAAQATLKHYFPDDSRPDIVIAKVNNWIKNGVEVPDDFADTLFPNINEGGMYQAADEAYNIFYGLLKTLNKESAYEAIIDILYDAITGDAISPFAAAKRDLFNWWIIDVVPSAYCLKLPSNLYQRTSVFPSLSEHLPKN
ncbi:hypothetical protein WA1_11320 [Scytonema hofmannii PCC 7110]|uniref:Uncharacterized protein n=1 Tax=Scytonema hofmannii PCC 7110 TaxID=128403 RepID=A0A139XFF2_9CYAN|nr:hypothetical protein [Scytonema hofmannii]KYC43420.1 hypothetical protein WA1_11320 [Scytonema hofmannii PCC 7110]